MSSTQRIENSYAFFKTYVTKKNSVVDFITRFDMALGHQRYQELQTDHTDVNEQPIKIKIIMVNRDSKWL